MILAVKYPMSYVGLYQKFLYKRFSLFMTLLPPKTILTPSLMQRRLRLGQGEHCSVILNNMHPSAVVSEHFLNALPAQSLDYLCVTHQYQVTRCSLSYESVLFSYANIPEETLHCDKTFAVVR